MPRFLSFSMLLTTLAFSSYVYSTDEATHHDITIRTPWSKAVPNASTVAAAFFTIENKSQEADQLIAASTPVAATTELHAHTKHNGMMKMRKVEAINIEANETTMLKPGGYHVMLFDLNEVPHIGETFPVTLTFKQAGSMTINVPVKAANTEITQKQHDHAHHHH